MAQAKTGPNWFAIIIASVTVLALAGIAIGVVLLNRAASAPGATPSASIIDTETGAISFGEGDDVLATYVDYRCPGCAYFEQTYGPAITQAVAQGEITLNLHPIAIMNHATQGTNYSSRAASATYCVAEEAPEATLDFLAILFDNQPTGGLSDEQIIAFAQQTGAGAAADCISQRTYVKFADAMTPLTPAGPDGRISTPTVVINGERIDSESVPTAMAELLG